MSTSFLNLYTRLQSLAIFRQLLDDKVINSLCEYLSCDVSKAEKVSKYSAFVSDVYSCGADSFAKYVQSIVGDCENVYIRTVGVGRCASKELLKSVSAELDTLQAVASLTPEDLRADIGYDGFLPEFVVENVNIPAEYKHRTDNISVYGYGIYAKYHMFYFDQNRHIVPVRNPDSIRLASLVDYKREQKIIMDNTVALLEGKPAANILLTGDAGTGKSSTIKAVVNELCDRGLRILEVRKEQLHALPAVLDELSMNPLKFIIFIDDLSFQRDDDNFSALKAILEGSVSAKSRNVAIYATSNRRHLVKETFSSRDGDDVHRNDTMQEILSLSARFGIHVSFYKPDKQTYLHIVSYLADEKGIDMPLEELYILAERFALEKGGRSARAATQFIDSLVSQN